MPSANCGPGLPASPELTTPTAASGPAVLPSPIVCEDKRDADSPTLWQGGRAREGTADPGGSSGRLLGPGAQGPLQLPRPQGSPGEAARLSEASATSR